MSTTLLDPMPTLRLGRVHTLHRVRVLIEDRQVVIRTACGLDASDATPGHDTPTCGPCQETQP